MFLVIVLIYWSRLKTSVRWYIDPDFQTGSREPECGAALNCQNFILFYFILSFKIKFGNIYDNFGEFLAQYSGFYFYFIFQFGDPQEELAKFGYRELFFLKRIHSCYILATC